jgi:hypothetical protein
MVPLNKIATICTVHWQNFLDCLALHKSSESSFKILHTLSKKEPASGMKLSRIWNEIIQDPQHC